MLTALHKPNSQKSHRATSNSSTSCLNSATVVTSRVRVTAVNSGADRWRHKIVYRLRTLTALRLLIHTRLLVSPTSSTRPAVTSECRLACRACTVLVSCVTLCRLVTCIHYIRRTCPVRLPSLRREEPEVVWRAAATRHSRR